MKPILLLLIIITTFYSCNNTQPLTEIPEPYKGVFCKIDIDDKKVFRYSFSDKVITEYSKNVYDEAKFNSLKVIKIDMLSNFKLRIFAKDAENIYQCFYLEEDNGNLILTVGHTYDKIDETKKGSLVNASWSTFNLGAFNPCQQ